MISGIHHVNILVPDGTLDQATEFYSDTLGLESAPVPELQKGTILWFNLTPDGSQQIHVNLGPNPELDSQRHACLRVSSLDELQTLQKRILAHQESGGPAAPMDVDRLGMCSGPTGEEYPRRFFARDFAGNRLEFSV
ncbi:putative glyoxalase family protein [Aspergillus brunneoviolaceus CBS 621.78]|uniref:VOC domain-containing protein n=2 Tax=Aspergillus TaxID=5052 RepID=A0A8G1RM60_9EURO|nr:hypothetical protein BO95DRAFT_461932 [Aspergillus brunneoviolaceus CBS 621.78]XP_040798330.1 uncharacterized protein BO72DRAFT_470956 [Aspergillus fijiensis CBS 313.89]RAH47553.1 hypothetical protein BO95DRAFT_461932 [Aspergillus brunneoviolaceus CBS 621.78]RAK74320.1 hypothetical protein BO72DRAFT_470956 [Aspergillus fijiensis CBS 313.89]